MKTTRRVMSLPERVVAATRAAGALVASHHRLALVLVALIVGVAGLGLPGLGTSISAASFLDADDPALDATRDRSELFGDDPIVVLFEIPAERAVVAPTLTSLVVLERDLASLPGVARVDGAGTVIDAAVGGVARVLGGILATVDGARLEAADQARREAEAAGLPPQQVEAAVATAVDGADEPQLRRYGPLLAEHMRLGLPELDNPAFTRAVALNDDGSPRPLVELVIPDARHVALHVRPTSADNIDAVTLLVERVRETIARSPLGAESYMVTGAPVVSAALAQDVRREVPWLALVGAMAMAVLLLSANRAPRPLAPLLGVGAGLLVGLGALGWLGLDLGLGAVAVAPIVLGLGTDFGVNIGHWYLRARELGVSSADAVGEAWVRTLPPLGLSSLVAAAASMVAVLAPSPTIRALGIALPLTLLCSLLMSLVVNGALLATAPERRRRTVWDWLRNTLGVRRPHRPSRERWATVTSGAVLAVGVAGWIALPLLAVEADTPTLVGESDELADARAAERVLGAAGTVELLVESQDVSDPTVLRWIDGVVGEVAQAEGQDIRAMLWPNQLLSWLGPDADAAAIHRGLETLPESITRAVLHPDRTAAAATFGIPWSSSSEQARLLSAMRAASADPPEGVTARLAGLPVLVASAYDGVATTPVRDTLIGVGAATAMLVVVLRRRSWMPVTVLVIAAGLRIAVFAAIGGALDPITLSLVAFVAAVDAEFALVFLSVRRLGESGRQLATRVTGVSAATAAAGFGVLTLSQVAGVRAFGTMAAVAVLAGWLGAVALFSGPFRPRDVEPRQGVRAPAKRRLAAGVSAAALLVVGCSAPDQLDDEALVDVGESTITEEDLANRIGQLRALYQLDVPPAGTDAHTEFRSDLLASMVAIELVERGAEERDVWVPEADITDRLETYRAASYPWDDQYRAALAATGMGETQVRKELRYQLLQRRLFDDVTADVEVSDEDVRAAYNEDPKRFDLPERRRVRHLIVDDQQTAEQARRALADGIPFEEVVAAVSRDEATRERGGDLGLVSQDQLLEGFGAAVFDLRIGEISAPIGTELGVHVAQVTEIEPPDRAKLAEVIEVIREQLAAERREARWLSWLRDVRDSTDIRYADGIEPVEVLPQLTPPDDGEVLPSDGPTLDLSTEGSPSESAP